MNISEVRKVVGKIKSNLFKNSNYYSIGMLKSHFKGHGIQFKEHQIYSHGDDIKLIDWKILARTMVPYIKTFEEERNVKISVVIDASITMLSGFEGVSKLQAAIEICCLLYLLSQVTKDKIGAIIISDNIIRLPFIEGEKGISLLVSELEKKGILTKEGKVNIFYRPETRVGRENILNAVRKDLSSHREMVLLSDFHDFIPLESLEKIIYKSRLHCFRLVSPLDEATKIPYSIYSTDGLNFQKGRVARSNVDGSIGIRDYFNKRFKILKVQERYLEHFIKEMI
jgi:hypothetical protein